ncbi:hypothetical protein ACQEU3_40050 [Spirillospora sp. CA-253888]
MRAHGTVCFTGALAGAWSIADGRLQAPIAKAYRGLEQVRDAQAGVESATTPGEHVVLLDD